MKGAESVLRLSRDVAVAMRDNEEIAHCDLLRVRLLIDGGNLADGRVLWAEVCRQGHLKNLYEEVPLEADLIEGELLWREGKLTEAWLLSASRKAERHRSRYAVRSLYKCRGAWHKSAGRYHAAFEAFDHAVAMAREVGLDEPVTEAERGVSLAYLGRREEALVAAERAESEGSPYAPLAELYLSLADDAKAKENALAGYLRYWAEGPPYCLHWELQTCRKVLKALGEPEPQLPPFDPARVEPIVFEAEIRRLIQEHETKRRARHSPDRYR
jgi:tetratricopeptide (TPR) repeat protein